MNERSPVINFKALYPLPQSLLSAIKFAKAQIVLSDSWQLGDINSCFTVSYRKEVGERFLLGENRLSEQLWNFKYTPILERFSINYHYQAKNFTDQKVIGFNFTEYHVSCKNDGNSGQKDSIHKLETNILVFYSGVLTWHEHKHLNRLWKSIQPISVMNSFS